MFKSAYSTTHQKVTPPANGKQPFFQAKLTVNEPGDVYEQEADAVADKVMRMKAPSVSDSKMQLKPIPFSQISRKCAACEEKEKVQRKESTSGGGQTAPPIVNDVISSSGKSLDGGTRQFMESRMGHDFSNVQVHTDSKAAESATSVNALAYTSGNHVVFNHGQYAPDTEGGKRLLAHELVHVGQQCQSPSQILSRRTLPLSGLQVNIDLSNLAGVTDTQLATAITSTIARLVPVGISSVLNTIIAALTTNKKRWLLSAIDVLEDNQAAIGASFNIAAGIERLVNRAGVSVIPFGETSVFSNEVLTASGWFEIALTSGLSIPNSAEGRFLRNEFSRGTTSGSTATLGCPTTRSTSQALDVTILQRDLPPILNQNLGILAGRIGITTASFSQLLPISDLVQQHALQYFSPFATQSTNSLGQRAWQYSAHLTQSTAVQVTDFLRLAYLNNRIRTWASPALQRAHFDDRCTADENALDLFFTTYLSSNPSKLAELDSILQNQTRTSQNNEVILETRYDSQSRNSCDARWSNIESLCHELMHVMIHPNFHNMSQQVANEHLIREGFPQLLGEYLYNEISRQARAYRWQSG